MHRGVARASQALPFALTESAARSAEMRRAEPPRTQTPDLIVSGENGHLPERTDESRKRALRFSMMGELVAFVMGWLLAAVNGFTWYVLAILIAAPIFLLHDVYLWRRRFGKRSAKSS